MEILKNSNNYYGLVSDYKDGYEFKDTIREQHNARGKLRIVAMVDMILIENDWKQVKVPCETSKAFYHAVETDIPAVVEEVIEEVVEEVVAEPLDEDKQIVKNVIDEEDILPHIEETERFEFHNNDGTEDEFNREYSQELTDEIERADNHYNKIIEEE